MLARVLPSAFRVSALTEKNRQPSNHTRAILTISVFFDLLEVLHRALETR